MGEIKNAYKILDGKHEGKDYADDLGVNGKIILNWIFGLEDVDWMHLAEDRDQCRAVVNTVMNLRIP
jgi:hypothetical protein